MDYLFIALLTVFSLSKDNVVNAVIAGVYIHPAGPKHVSTLGSALTFSCIVSGQLDSRTEYILKWSFNTAAVFPCTAIGSSGAVLYEKGCNLTIHSVEVSSEGVYTCDLLDLEGSEIRDSVELYVIDPLLTPTMYLLDLSTGDTLNISSGPICLHSEEEQTFECTVRDTKPGIWNIVWIIEDRKVEGCFMNETIGTGGLVNVSSRFTLPIPREDDFQKNMTCLAAVLDRVSFKVMVQLQKCADEETNTTIDLLNLYTGGLVDINSDPVCVQMGVTRNFECSVRNTKPGVWNITWVIGEKRKHAGFNETTSITAGGLVNVSSRLSLLESGKERVKKNLSCRATSFDGESLIVAVQLQSCEGVHPNPTINLMDLLTGRLVGIDAMPICIQPNTERTFKCTVREIIFNDWNITWIVDGTEIEAVFTKVTPSTRGVVNVSSLFNISTSRNEGVTRNLACHVTGPESELLNITVQLTFCSGNVPTATVDVVDLLTGDLILINSQPICVPIGTARTFECTVRQTKPDVSMSWLIDNFKIETVSVNVTPGTGELVDMKSKYTVFNSRDEGLIHSLACLTMGFQTDLRVDLQLQSCAENIPAANGDNTLLVAEISVLGAMLIIVVIAFVIFAARSKKAHRMTLPTTVQSSWDDDESVEMENLAPDTKSDTQTHQATPPYENNILQGVSPGEVKDSGLPSWAEGWGIIWSDLIVDERVLGSGNFGEVRSGAVKIAGEVTRAAIKMLKGHASRSDRDDFMDEFWTMASIGFHPNIVLLLGACQHQDILYVALEYLPHGDLRSYLRTARSQSDSDEDALSSDQLVKFALDVAKGMEHLARAGVIHRDLAARNILLGEGLVAKVSDFGLSRGEDIYVQTSRRRVPLRWLAIESVKHHVYTTQSDVWSFGILLWEIATFGGTPYPSIQNEMLAATLKRGYRMPKPENCHDEVYALMRMCWDEDPNNRPAFPNLVFILRDMSDNQIKHTYMAVDRDQYQNLSAIRPELDDD